MHLCQRDWGMERAKERAHDDSAGVLVPPAGATDVREATLFRRDLKRLSPRGNARRSGKW